MSTKQGWYLLVGAVVVLILGFGAWTLWVQNTNKANEVSTILKPFSGYLAPSRTWTVNTSANNPGVGKNPQDGLFLVGMGGGNSSTTPQITCPVGFKINIVSAFVDVVDPNGSCTTSPSPTVQATCGVPTPDAADCQVGGSECGAGMHCPAGKCVAKTCKVSNDCAQMSTSGNVRACPAALGQSCSVANSDPTLKCVNGIWQLDPGSGPCMACVGGMCVSYPTCQNSPGGRNVTCQSSGAYKCKPRDASAYLASHCDGKSECLADPSDKWVPNSIRSVFGPLPCEIDASSNDVNYASLPISTGWGGGSPNQSMSGNSSPVTFNQGYYVHGLYTCVPDYHITEASS